MAIIMNHLIKLVKSLKINSQGSLIGPVHGPQQSVNLFNLFLVGMVADLLARIIFFLMFVLVMDIQDFDGIGNGLL